MIDRKYAVTVWDSVTGETFECTVALNLDSINGMISKIHEAVCKETGEDPSDWQLATNPVFDPSAFVLFDDQLPVAGSAIYRSSQGDISTVSFCRLS